MFKKEETRIIFSLLSSFHAAAWEKPLVYKQAGLIGGFPPHYVST